MGKKQIVISINMQTVDAQHLRLFRAIPQADVIQEVGVNYAGRWLRSVYEENGQLKPRKNVKK